ncbi:MAG: hypothetical protein A3D65_05865 [Candidatus Lloydbacteria bacterium RIFCSPHIGHO2_02_FULL_50_13]|uniref:Uncharacterized protein n=1 Tax=Candidatus Lloydbacteria bacterium RIFCSPHIGHO2_02_FULL_50_13 TaxID=1798661 RepID=A0A1G2D722_9BACT|nr:MAG: hypothetical protein A3D65_05865 [Candidatus Lloydbacteria bacterium RIFCSPHIGHO2_02_FULL_50_13]
MSILLTIWLLSLLVLLGLVFYARSRRSALTLPRESSAGDFGDFLMNESRAVGEEFWRGAARLRPHGERVIVESGVLIKKGHNMLIEKAFGRIAAPKGKASSFFLKRIAEHKDALRGKIEE